MMESGRALNHNEWIPVPPINLISTATPTAAPFLSLPIAYHFRLHLLLHSSFKKLSRLCHVPRLKDLWCQRAFQFKGTNFFHFTNDSFSSPCLHGFCFLNGGDSSKNSGNEGTSHLETSRRNSFNGRQWTNVLLAVNVLTYVAQIATKGKLLFWGAKINSLIDKGQFWRLVTSSFLHANIPHLVVNCYSLNSIGPTMESVSGPRRYLAVYFSSAVASSAMSYWFSKPPAVGASGAIFGLVGSLAVFVTRHRRITGGGRGDLQQIAQVIFLNMVIGLLYKGVDNWGHLGGLLGGAAMSWLLGPAWKYESMCNDGLRIFSDRAPIFNLINKQRKPRQLN